MRMQNVQAALVLMIPCLWSSNILAQERELIAELHANPPSPCVAKPVGDMSSGIAIVPTGETREQVRGIMGRIASFVLGAGASYMTAENIQVVYTAVFYEAEPINEVGIYAYKFAETIDRDMFRSNPELNGKLFVIDQNLLVILWYEDRTARCFSAIDAFLTAMQ